MLAGEDIIEPVRVFEWTLRSSARALRRARRDSNVARGLDAIRRIMEFADKGAFVRAPVFAGVYPRLSHLVRSFRRPRSP